MINSLESLYESIETIGIEATLEILNIDDIPDHTIQTILHVIEHSIISLKEELEVSLSQ